MARYKEVEQLLKEGVDIVSGGFPCQDISHLGKKEGISGANSGLWGEMVRTIRMVRPKFAIMENVAALLNRGASRIFGDLAEIGYDSEWDCIPASFIGSPHRRDRAWIVSYPSAISRRKANSEALPIGKKKETREMSFNSYWRQVPPFDWEIPETVSIGVVNGIPNRLDRSRALGNAIVPQVAYSIMKGIKA